LIIFTAERFFLDVLDRRADELAEYWPQLKQDALVEEAASRSRGRCGPYKRLTEPGVR
jgi:hypothetical protein